MPRGIASNGEVSYSVTNLDSALTMLMAVDVYGEEAVKDTKQIALGNTTGGGKASLMMWGASSYNDRIESVFFHNRRAINAQTYVRDVLQAHVVPYTAMHINVFQQDNTRAPTARYTQQFLEQSNV
ncbi:transposable element Tcb2 transposase [Elysia marginata]|uniref:Transposable element Tcb2 transposase n=1 Tax=Elysia marginata TaxID=1093978 RepID=A0AAV4ETV4_9GAST|nr:transposable element Tcb2 transposase [Elysia marginata]